MARDGEAGDRNTCLSLVSALGSTGFWTIDSRLPELVCLRPRAVDPDPQVQVSVSLHGFPWRESHVKHRYLFVRDECIPKQAASNA